MSMPLNIAAALPRCVAPQGIMQHEGVCEAHGAYRAFTRAGLPALCPQCLETQTRAQTQSHLQAQRSARLRAAHGVPERFAHSGLRDFQAVTENARAVRAAVMHYLCQLKATPQGWRPLLLTGAPGTGKTHLLCAIAHNLAEAGIEARYATLHAMLAEIKRAYNEPLLSEWGQIQRYVQPAFLALDEVDLMRASDNDRLLVFAVINARYNALKATAIACNQQPERLAEFLTERVVDRLRENALTLRCDWPSARSPA